MPGRPRKPTAELEASGAFERNPKRKRLRVNEPAPNGPIGDPPDYFDQNHCNVWYKLASLAPAGALAKSDRLHLEVTVRFTVRMRRAPARTPKWLSFLIKTVKVVGMQEQEAEELRESVLAALRPSPQELGVLTSCVRRIGMSPADRSRVINGTKKTDLDDPLGDAFAALSRV